jgi:hypothetical protein
MGLWLVYSIWIRRNRNTVDTLMGAGMIKVVSPRFQFNNEEDKDCAERYSHSKRGKKGEKQS